MQRQILTPRQDWQQQLEKLGFDFHTPAGKPYWDESACYRFSAAEIDALEEATNELEAMCLQAVSYIIEKNLFSQLCIPAIAQEAIQESWQRQDKNLYGRFDLAYDGHNPPKLLEYNADTPTSLLEASVIQWQWLESLMPQKDQFNSVHERLIDAWQRMQLSGSVYFSCIEGHAEDERTTLYLQDTAAQAGLKTNFLSISAIGSDGQYFYDLAGKRITHLFKLYPWEWLWMEEFAPIIRNSGTQFIEPAWKLLLSNKGLLVILWEMFGDHPYLLQASFEADTLPSAYGYAQKPLYSREGANIRLFSGTEEIASSSGVYGAEGYVYQQYTPLPCFNGNYPVLGSWVVASQSAGMGIREDTSPITKDTARFIPHYFE